MSTFIIRRLIVTVFLLLVVSLITFAIFFRAPRLAGQNNYELAVQYVGRTPTPSAVHAIEKKLGFDQPIIVQYGRVVRGIVLGLHYDAGTNKTYCPPPRFCYSVRNQQPVAPMMASDLPVTAPLAIAPAAIWLA